MVFYRINVIETNPRDVNRVIADPNIRNQYLCIWVEKFSLQNSVIKQCVEW